MKVGITGANRGLGKAICDNLCAKWIPVALNRPEYDISNDEGIKKLVNELSDSKYKVFINNAHSPFAQTKILAAVYLLWKDDPTKTIININSRAKYPNLSKGHIYSASKSSLSHLSDSLKFTTDKKCKIIDVNPGLLESDLPSLTYNEVADLIVYIMNRPQHIEISEISVYHNKSYVEVQKQKQIKLNESRKNMGKN